MKKLATFKSAKGGPVKRMFLIVSLIGVLLLIFRDIIWLYESFEYGFGTRMAQVAVSYHIVLLLGMIAVGVGLGHMVNRMMHDKTSIFQCPRKGGKTEKFMQFWGYKIDEEELMKAMETELPIDPPIMDPFVLLDLPVRRGRKPAFPLDRWVPIAMKWENRDPMRDAFTLGELISEHLGTNSDGSPIISEQTYYSVWRQRAIDEIRQRAECRQKELTRPGNKQG